MVYSNEAVRIDPGDAGAWSDKARALSDQERYDEALEAFVMATEIDPDHPEAWLGLGEALSALGRTGEAGAAFGRAGEPVSSRQ